MDNGLLAVEFLPVGMRRSDGSITFTPDRFGPDITITGATYRTGPVDARIQVSRLLPEGRVHWRLVDDLRGPGTTGLGDLQDDGFSKSL